MKLTVLRIAGVMAVGISAAAVVTCSVYDSSLVGPAETQEAGTTCEHATFPLKPPAGGGDGVDFTGALTTFDFGEQYDEVDQNNNYIIGENGKPITHAARETGFDLDKLCTINEDLNLPSLYQEPACHPLANWFSPRSGDMPGGRDNGLRYVISGVASAFRGFGTQIYNRNIQEGKVSLLLRVKDYNGEANDDSVTVIVYIPGSFSDANHAAPKFDGTDRWPISSESYKGGDVNQPTIVGSGYVTNGVVVGAIGNMDYRLRIGISADALVDMRVQLNRVFLTGKISKDPETGNHWRLDQGQIAGRWLTHDLLAATKYFPNPDRSPGQPTRMCMNASLYGLVRTFICASADIPIQDGLPNPECDAISVGIAFTGVEVTRGETVDLPPLIEDCGNMDPAADSCLRNQTEYKDARADSGVPPVTVNTDAGG